MKIQSLFIQGFTIAAYTMWFLGSDASAQTQTKQVLRDSVHPGVFLAKPVSGGELPATRSMNLAISLPVHNLTKLNATLEDLYNPASPNFHHWLKSDEFVSQFGPTTQDVAKVISFAQKYGLTITKIHSNHLVVDVSGPVSAVSQAFNVKMRTYRHPTEGRNFFGPDKAPTVDSWVPIQSVEGLENFVVHTPQTKGPIPSSGWDYHDAYAPGVTLDGTGQRIALFEWQGPVDPDSISGFATQVGGSPINYQYVLLDGYTPPVAGSGVGGGEEDLDVYMAYSMAPGATIVTYNGSSSFDIFNQIATDNNCKLVSCSEMVSPPPSGLDQIFQQMAAQGQSVFEASGDSGFQGASSFGWNDNPYITLVGGTVLNSNPNGSWQSEVGWPGSQGGVSPSRTIPSWQQGIDMTACGGSTTMRNMPDVSMNGTSGTSGSAPLWAGFMALVDQQAAAQGNPPAGFINPAVYAILKGPNYLVDFHDITSGNSYSGLPNGSFSQTVSFSAAGSHTLSFQAALRSSTLPGANSAMSVQVLVNGTLVGTYTPSSTTSWTSYTTPSFSVNSGNNTITFTAVGTCLQGGLFVANVSLSGTGGTLANGTFATPSEGAGNFAYNPTGGTWTFTGQSGIQANGSAWGAPNSPSGTQTAFLQILAPVNCAPGYDLVTGIGSPTGQPLINDLSGVPISSFALRNTSFETPNVGAGNFQYNPTGGAWAFSGLSGIQSNGSVWAAPMAPDGTQTAFLQSSSSGINGSISQTVSFSGTGTYTLTYQSALRASPHNGAISFNVLVDGTVVGTCAPTTTGSFTTYATNPFTIATVGNHTLTFTAVGTAVDSSVFIDAVSLNPIGIANGSFETPSVGASGFQYNSIGGSWTFSGNSGIQSNGSAWGAPMTPSGTQTAFLQIIDGTNNGSMSQAFYCSAGSYVLSFQSALRGGYNPISFNVMVDGTAVGTYSPTTTTSFTPYITNPFTLATAGNHTVTFAAAGSALDGSVFIDTVSLGIAGLADSSFESPSVSGGFSYGTTGSPWTFSAQSGNNGAGITGNGSGFTSANANAPEGIQAAFLQGTGSFSQVLTGLVPGASYTLTFSAAQRVVSNINGQTWQVKLDGTVIGSYAPPQSATAYTNYTASFTATATSQNLAFNGTDTRGGDNTVFIDNISLSGIPSVPIFRNGPPPAIATVNAAYNFSYQATGIPVPTFALTSGNLPPGLTLTSAGVLSGTLTTMGSYVGTISASNGVGSAATQNFSITVMTTFSQWEAFYSISSGPMATPQNDGVPNLLKYFYDINPTAPMSATDRAALPSFAVTSEGDLTVTFRENSLETGITLNVQTSSDSQTWTTVSQATNPTAGSYTLQPTGTIDPNTGDPYMKVDFKPANAPSQLFIRLNVVGS